MDEREVMEECLALCVKLLRNGQNQKEKGGGGGGTGKRGEEEQ